MSRDRRTQHCQDVFVLFSFINSMQSQSHAQWVICGYWLTDSTQKSRRPRIANTIFQEEQQSQKTDTVCP